MNSQADKRTTDAFTIPDMIGDNTPDFPCYLLRQKDFDTTRRNYIYHQLKVGDKTNPSIEEVLRAVEPRIQRAYQSPVTSDKEYIVSLLLEALLRRPQAYYTMRYIKQNANKTRTLPDPQILVMGRGEEKWYGPTNRADDRGDWYIRPVFFRYSPSQHRAYDPNVHDDEPGEDWFDGRWLVFARVGDVCLSLHWRGFTANKGVIIRYNTRYESSFPYWLHINKLTSELEQQLGISSSDVPLQYMVLTKIWEALREQKDTLRWEDILIKANNKGIKLNARSTRASIENDDADYTDIEGIRHLARTIRSGINVKLKSYQEFQDGLPEPEEFDG